MNREILLAFIDGLIKIANDRRYEPEKEVKLNLPPGLLMAAKQTPLQTQLITLSCDLLGMNDGRNQQLHRTLLAMAACISRNMEDMEYAGLHPLYFCQQGKVYYDPEATVWFGNMLSASHRLRTFCDDFMSVLSGRTALVATDEESESKESDSDSGLHTVTLENPLTLQLDLFGDIIARQSDDDALTDEPSGMPKGWIAQQDAMLGRHVWNIMLGLLARDNLLPENVDLATITVKKGKLHYRLKHGDTPVLRERRLLVA